MKLSLKKQNIIRKSGMNTQIVLDILDIERLSGTISSLSTEKMKKILQFLAFILLTSVALSGDDKYYFSYPLKVCNLCIMYILL